jgi:hypothetical protein
MRTTVIIDDALMKKVRRLAASKGRTFTEILTEALGREVMGEKRGGTGFRLNLVTVTGRPRPGVDLSDRDALYEIMGDEK